MSPLRAILGRFARFLVRIARTLDPAAAGAPYWVMPERMAALRQRYPGAPEHWLEFVARRTPVNEIPEANPAPPPVPPYEPTFEPDRPPRRALDGLRSFLRLRGRPTTMFPAPAVRASPRQILSRPEVPAIAPTPPEQYRRASTTQRPALTFSVKPVRNPIANLVRIGRPARRQDRTQFPATDAAVRPESAVVEPAPATPRDHETYFPDRAARPIRPAIDIARADHEPPAVETERRWPRRSERPNAELAWPAPRGEAVRSAPTFRGQDPRWPDLPPSATELGAAAPSLEDAIRLAEQVGGTWNG